MVHDHADLAATGWLIHIPVPEGKGRTMEILEKHTLRLLCPFFFMRFHWPASVRLCFRAWRREKEELMHCQQVDTCCWSSVAVTINHLTFVTTSLQGGIYYVLMSAKLLWEIAASTELVWKILIFAFFFGFVLVGLIFSYILRRDLASLSLKALPASILLLSNRYLCHTSPRWWMRRWRIWSRDILRFRGCQSRR